VRPARTALDLVEVARVMRFVAGQRDLVDGDEFDG